ncbi:hypothetical protein Ga0061060_12535 [Anoxybacillus suryakundensis]|uniref:Uncharacterized protein n=1 Tax=Anoxybacillus suryakundensis TaxID=1325335 RepID=A0A0K6GRT5_9BACL|nr:hypothetical protein Ga0061060_12535 [Anoxybacillus suryakundensis]
MYEIIRSWIT